MVLFELLLKPLEQLEADDPDAIKRFGEEVAPALREAVASRAENARTGVL